MLAAQDGDTVVVLWWYGDEAYIFRSDSGFTPAPEDH